jgi:Uma2 family endonuclease
MSGGPSRRHQKISRNLTRKILYFLEEKTCELYYDLTVRLSKNTVVRPDISVICDPDKLDDQGCNGAPDLIIEILSPSNAGNDLWIKYNQYLKAGVKEYWIVDPIKNEVTIYILDDGIYIGAWHSENSILPVTVLPGCEIDLNAIFATAAHR